MGRIAPLHERIRPLTALQDIFYPGRYGRGVIFCFPHKLRERPTAAPRCTPATASTAVTFSHSGPDITSNAAISTRRLSVK
jgi:hypothetical protein